MWYIISAKPGAKLVYDVMPGTSRESFAEAVAANDVERCLNTMEVSAGDVIYIPAGMVHAIGKGIIIAEIQQNSDTTYRVYDYGRVGRELHIEKALDVIDFGSAGSGKKCSGITLPLSSGGKRKIVVSNRYFCTEIYDIGGSADEIANGSRFHTYVFVSGTGTIVWEGGRLPVRAGESVLIPAAMGKYTLEGNLTALKTFKPDLEKDVIHPLKEAGFEEDLVFSEIAGLRKPCSTGRRVCLVKAGPDSSKPGLAKDRPALFPRGIIKPPCTFTGRLLLCCSVFRLSAITCSLPLRWQLPLKQ